MAALRMEALCAWAVERAEGFPRKLKFSIGDRFIESNLLVVERLVEAAYQRDKRAVLQAASRALVRARVLGQRHHPITLTPIPPGFAATTLRSF